MNIRNMIPALCLCVFCVSVAAQAPAPAPATPAAPAAAAGATDLSAGDPVVARVAGEAITEKEVLGVISQLALQQRIPPAQAQQKNVLLYKQAIDNLVAQILLRREAEEKKMSVDQARIDEQHRNITARFPSDEKYRQELQKQGITEAGMRRSIRNNLLVQQVVEDTVKAAPAPTEQEIKQFYDENPKYFEQPEQVHAAHILLKVDPKATPEQKAEVRKKLEETRAEIENKKMSFADAAKLRSQDEGSAANGGDLGFFSRSDMVPPFAAAAFGATPGTLTPVVETQYGYHLIQVIETRPAGRRSLDASKADITNFLGRKSRQEVLDKHIAELKGKAQVETLMSQEEWNRRNAQK